MKKRILGIAAVAVLVISAAVLAVGHGFQERGGHGRSGGPSHGDMLEHMARELSLTDAQKQQVKAVMDSMGSTAEATHAKLNEIKKQLDAATANGQFDETQVRNLANQQAQIQAEMTVEHLRTKSKVFGILTAEQRTKAEEMHKRGGGRGRHAAPFRHPGF